MKKLSSNKLSNGLLLMLGFSAILAGCDKGTGFTERADEAAGKAKAKFIHVNNIAPTAANLNLFINDAKYSGANPVTTTNPHTVTGLTYNSVYPGLEYLTIPAGTVNYKAVVPTVSTVLPGATLAEGTTTLTADKEYSIFVIDSFPASVLVVEDKLPASPADSGKVAIRFVNTLMKNTGVDVFKKLENTTLFTNVAYKTATDYKITNSGIDTFFIRRPATTTNVIPGTGATTYLAVNLTANRVYTIFTYGIDGSTAKPPRLNFYTSQFQPK